MAVQSMIAAERLEPEGIRAEVIDLRSIKPWDAALAIESARKTGRVVIADPGWKTGGVAAEIAATVGAEVFDRLRAPIERVTLPDAPAPVSRAEERAYYPDASDICAAARRALGRRSREAAA
jgi:pyruvate dehydrogenase E1 component beta subunit